MKKFGSILLALILCLFITPWQAEARENNSIYFYSDHEENAVIDTFMTEIGEYDFGLRLSKHLTMNDIYVSQITIGMPFKMTYPEIEELYFYYFPIFGDNKIVTFIELGEFDGELVITGLGKFFNIDMNEFNESEIYHIYSNLDDSAYAVSSCQTILIKNSPSGGENSMSSPDFVSLTDVLENDYYVDIMEELLTINFKPTSMPRDGAWLWRYEPRN